MNDAKDRELKFNYSNTFTGTLRLRGSHSPESGQTGNKRVVPADLQMATEAKSRVLVSIASIGIDFPLAKEDSGTYSALNTDGTGIFENAVEN